MRGGFELVVENLAAGGEAVWNLQKTNERGAVRFVYADYTTVARGAEALRTWAFYRDAARDYGDPRAGTGLRHGRITMAVPEAGKRITGLELSNACWSAP